MPIKVSTCNWYALPTRKGTANASNGVALASSAHTGRRAEAAIPSVAGTAPLGEWDVPASHEAAFADDAVVMVDRLVIPDAPCPFRTILPASPAARSRAGRPRPSAGIPHRRNR